MLGVEGKGVDWLWEGGVGILMGETSVGVLRNVGLDLGRDTGG